MGIIPGVSFALLGGGEGIRNDGSEAQVSLGPASDPSRASSHKYLLFMRRDTANKKSREVLIFKLQTRKEQCGETNCIHILNFAYFTTIEKPESPTRNPDKNLKSPKAWKARKGQARKNSTDLAW